MTELTQTLAPEKTRDGQASADTIEKSTQPNHAEVLKILDGLPSEQKDVMIKAFTYMEQRSFSGPLPAPEDFIRYREALPDAPERIMIMAEKQTDHRIKCEQDIIKAKKRENLIGQIAGFLIAICCLVVACILGLNGHDWLAGVIPTSIAGLAAIFVLRKRKPDNPQSDDSQLPN